MAIQTMIDRQVKLEECPVCNKSSVTGERFYSVWDAVITLALLVVAFPIAIFYIIFLFRKDYEFSCSCGYKWRD